MLGSRSIRITIPDNISDADLANLKANIATLISRAEIDAGADDKPQWIRDIQNDLPHLYVDTDGKE